MLVKWPPVLPASSRQKRETAGGRGPERTESCLAIQLFPAQESYSALPVLINGERVGLDLQLAAGTRIPSSNENIKTRCSREASEHRVFIEMLTGDQTPASKHQGNRRRE